MVDARQIFAQASQVKVESAKPEWTQILMQPTMDARNLVMGYIRCEISDLSGELGEQLALAVDELLRNAIEHGRGDCTQCSVEFTYIRTPHMIQFQIKDHGPGFAMNSVAHAAINNPPEEPLKHAHYRTEMGMRPGGFGIMLVKQIADDLIYNEAGNEVLLVKYLVPDGPIHSAEQL
jgi:anti-sigma regulatory factor (Ser/Thr protein kinase)